MSDYLSGREYNLKVGIQSYTEDKTVLEAIGNVDIVGIVTASKFSGEGSLLTNINVSSLVGVVSYSTSAGVSTYSTTAGIATYAVNAGVSTQLKNSKSFEITGDIIASPVFFDGTSNVSLSATIQPNSVELGNDTVGSYVSSITGTNQQIVVSGGTGEGSTPILSLPTNILIPQDATVLRDLQVNRNLNVNGNITIGGTSAIVYATELVVSDPDLVLGFRTDANNNDISNDNTANHGGIAIASTEGSPLINLFINDLEKTPPTYKKFMWFKEGTFAGLGTDSWISNYAIGIGSTMVPYGIRLAAGEVQFTEKDIKKIRDINSSGIITANKFSGDGSEIVGINATSIIGITSFATVSGIATNVIGGIASITNLNVLGVSTIGNVKFSGGIVTATEFVGNLTGIAYTTINLLGGSQGSIPVQSNVGYTTFISPGIYGQVLITNGPNQNPYWGPVNAATGSFGGITVQNNGNIVGSAASIVTLNFSGANIIASASQGSSGIATITVLNYVSTSGISTSVIGGIGSISQIQVTGISTFTNGPIIIGSANSTGTNYQRLQVTGGAYISNSIGIGTTNPSSILHVSGNSIITGISTIGNLIITPVGSGTTVGGESVTYYGDGSNLTGVTGLKVITQSAISTPAYPILASATGVSSVGIATTQLVYIPSTGNLGLGSVYPTSKLYVVGDIFVSGVTTSTDFNSSSDRNLKTNIEVISNPIEKLLEITGVTFNWKSNNKKSAGVIAQDVMNVMPELTSGEPLTLNYNGLIGLLIEAVKEQQKIINKLLEKHR